MAGQPMKQVDHTKLKALLETGLSKTSIAVHFDLSRPTLDRIITHHDLGQIKAWTTITDLEVDNLVLEALTTLPKSGERLIIGYFLSKGITIQRQRVREAIKRVDAEGLDARRETMHKTIRRRVYNVPHPHFLWHLDGNHKLVRWGLYVHAGIDGFSRACLYLRCSNNNRSITVLNAFEDAVARFSVIPRFVRTDYGTENYKVWQAMLDNHQGDDSSRPVLLGSSVHNQRVERFNRDINRNIRDLYATLFYKLETKGILDCGNLLDKFSLHYVFIPRINKSLDMLSVVHNNHKISTEGNATPNQLVAIHDWQYHPDEHHVPIPQSSDDMFRGIMDHPPVEPDTTEVLSNDHREFLLRTVPPDTEDGEYGLTVYEAVREYVHKHGQLAIDTDLA